MSRVITTLASFVILTALYPRYDSAGACPISSGILNRDPVISNTSIELEPVLTDLDQPLYITSARDGSNRLFVVERPGCIKLLLPGSGSPMLFLDVTDKVRTGGENGLLGLAFHPRHKDNGRFFICYSRQPDAATVISEYRVSHSDLNSVEMQEQVLLIIEQPSDIHHGGMIEFGPDNFLYISTGDGSWEDPDNSAQNLEDLRGKILRIDVDRSDGGKPYSSPPGNPYFGDTPGRDEIYAFGFRNPWRFAIDRVTGEFYVGDVGHEAREEVNIITPGGNYGWRVFEGTRCTDFEPSGCTTLGFIAPLIEYEHVNGRCSVTGGYVYRGVSESLPYGSYLFGDFCTGEILLLSEGKQQLLLDTDLRIASFGEDDDGEIYVVGLGGSVHRIVQASPEAVQIRIDSVQVRRRSTGELLQPVKVKKNGKKFEIIVRGASFDASAAVYVDGQRMKAEATVSTETEIKAKLRRDTLARPGSLVIEVVNPDGTRSNEFEIQVE